MRRPQPGGEVDLPCRPRKALSASGSRRCSTGAGSAQQQRAAAGGSHVSQDRGHVVDLPWDARPRHAAGRAG